MSLIPQIVNNVHRTRIISQRASWAIPTSSNMTATGVAMKPCRKALNVLRAEFLYTGGALGYTDHPTFVVAPTVINVTVAGRNRFIVRAVS